MKVEKYKMIASRSPEELNKEVNIHIRDGAIPYGNPFHSGSLYNQAVVYPAKVGSTLDREYTPL